MGTVARLGDENCLTDLPEEYNIRYLVHFVLVGRKTHTVVRHICESQAARELMVSMRPPLQLEPVDDDELDDAVEQFLAQPGMAAARMQRAVEGARPELGMQREVAVAGPKVSLLEALASLSTRPDTPASAGRARCLCGVRDYGSRADGCREVDLVQLAFTTLPTFQELPRISTKKEAVSSCAVIQLWIDGPPGHEPTQNGFMDQLKDLRRNCQEVVSMNKEVAKMRPQRAVLLLYSGCSGRADQTPASVSSYATSVWTPAGPMTPAARTLSGPNTPATPAARTLSGPMTPAAWTSSSTGGSTASTGGDNGWQTCLSDFEKTHGNIWKCGPVFYRDGDALHQIFEDMASKLLVGVDMGVLSDRTAASRATSAESRRPTQRWKRLLYWLHHFKVRRPARWLPYLST